MRCSKNDGQVQHLGGRWGVTGGGHVFLDLIVCFYIVFINLQLVSECLLLPKQGKEKISDCWRGAVIIVHVRYFVDKLFDLLFWYWVKSRWKLLQFFYILLCHVKCSNIFVWTPPTHIISTEWTLCCTIKRKHWRRLSDGSDASRFERW